MKKFAIVAIAAIAMVSANTVFAAEEAQCPSKSTEAAAPADTTVAAPATTPAPATATPAPADTAAVAK